MASPPFERLVRDHGAAVWNVCRALVGPHDADDAWSETFLAALRAYPTLPADANVRAWLIRIAHNEAIDLIRREQRQTRIWQRLGAEPAAPPPWPSAIGVTLDALTEHQRRAVAYHHLAGLPYAEVAPLLGCSPSAARKAASDGIAALRLALKENPHD